MRSPRFKVCFRCFRGVLLLLHFHLRLRGRRHQWLPTARLRWRLAQQVKWSVKTSCRPRAHCPRLAKRWSSQHWRLRRSPCHLLKHRINLAPLSECLILPSGSCPLYMLHPALRFFNNSISRTRSHNPVWLVDFCKHRNTQATWSIRIISWRFDNPQVSSGKSRLDWNLTQQGTPRGQQVKYKVCIATNASILRFCAQFQPWQAAARGPSARSLT